MDISGSAISGSLKVGLQVASNHKRPLLEVYNQVRNQFGPQEEYEIPVGVEGAKTITSKHRRQKIFIQFYIVNIGGSRACDIDIRISGELKRNPPREKFGRVFESTVSQMAPGQSLFLFSFGDFDLLEYPIAGGKSIGSKKQSFTITMSYNSPRGFINWFMSIPSRILGKKQHIDTYTFSPEMVAEDLPPAEYVT